MPAARRVKNNGVAGYEEVAIDSVRPDPKNVRLHNPRNLSTIRASLSRWGQQKPIVVDGDGIIIAGNGTYLAARELGWKTISVARTNLVGKEARAYGIADNRTVELSEFDAEGVLLAVEELGADAGLMQAIGFDEAELEQMRTDREGGGDETAPSSHRVHTAGRPIALVVAIADVGPVEQALRATGHMNRGQALLAICEAYLAAKR